MCESIPVEMVYQTSEGDQRQLLSDHFKLFYRLQVANHLVSDASFHHINSMERYFTGIPLAYNNAVFGCPKKSDWNQCIEEQLNYFNMPFVWYVEENTDLEFRQKLLDYDFKEGGMFRGVIGILDKPIPNPEVSKDCTLELVTNQQAMNEFIELVSQIFGYTGLSKELYGQFLIDAAKNQKQPMLHWLAKKEGKAVSAISTLIDGKMVSFWNGASLPEARCQGFSTGLRYLALKDAISKGCCIGSSYLMSEGLAYGICSKLGYQTKWKFHVFLSPKLQKYRPL